MKKLTKVLLTIIICLAQAVPSTPVGAQSSVHFKVISGKDRLETTAAVSREGWHSAHTVILAREDDFPDALAGTPLAHMYGAPILLTSRDYLVPGAREEILRLGPEKVILLGGEAALSYDIEGELRKMGIAVERIGGANRYDTARLIAHKVSPDPKKVMVVNGENYPDALSAAPYAAFNGYPILLTRSSSLPPETREVLEKARSTIVVGGTSAIKEELMGHFPGATRIAGGDRYETSLEVARQLGLDTRSLLLASGQDFAGALTGSVLAARGINPVILFNPGQNNNGLIYSIKAINNGLLGDLNNFSSRSFLVIGQESEVEEMVQLLKGAGDQGKEKDPTGVTIPRQEDGEDNGSLIYKGPISRDIELPVVDIQAGLASWYGSFFHGSPTASGEIFDMHGYTASHRELPFGTYLRVNYDVTGKSVLVRVNDRGPHLPGRIIDLSRGAAEAIGLDFFGVGGVTLEVLCDSLVVQGESPGEYEEYEVRLGLFDTTVKIHGGLVE